MKVTLRKDENLEYAVATFGEENVREWARLFIEVLCSDAE
jgi:hypothetical protein